MSRELEDLAKNLWDAADNKDIDKVSFLLENGADPNHQLYWSDDWLKNGKLPPVHNACEKGYLDIVTLLARGGANIEKKGGQLRRTAFHLACFGGNLEIVQYLSQALKCHTDAIDKYRRTALHWACLGGSEQIVRYLAENLKCNVGLKDDDNETPLHMACRKGHKKIVEFLVETVKYNTNVADNTEKTPLDLALEYNKADVVDYLRNLPQGNLTVYNAKTAVWDARAAWNHLAINLDIDMGTVTSIGKSKQNDPQECIVEVLKYWLANQSIAPSWLQLAEAVEDCGVDNMLVGRRIREMYIGP